MFDIGWSEILVIVAVAFLVIGPKDLPEVMHTLGRIARRASYIRYALTQQFDQFLKEHDLDTLRNDTHLDNINFEAPARSSETFDEARADEDDIVEKSHINENTAINTTSVDIIKNKIKV
jgi:sec-independent protein translocase protein TatB